jgi:hypothetical protein
MTFHEASGRYEAYLENNMDTRTIDFEDWEQVLGVIWGQSPIILDG